MSLSPGNIMGHTAIEVHPNRAEFILHRRRERFHDCKVALKSHADKFDAIR